MQLNADGEIIWDYTFGVPAPDTVGEVSSFGEDRVVIAGQQFRGDDQSSSRFKGFLSRLKVNDSTVDLVRAPLSIF